MRKPSTKNLQDFRKYIPSLTTYRELTAADVIDSRKYISEYWKKLLRFHPKSEDSLLGLPNPYLVPAHAEGHEFDFNEMYYWDSYFMVQGMYDDEHKELVVGILENLLYIFKTYKVIPNATRTYLTGRSQPPFLTTFIWEVYEHFDMPKKWLSDAMKIAEEEYKTVWLGTKKPNHRLVHEGLSRNYDINYLNDLAEAESGWDMTTRFNRKALDYLPIDLNSLLYKYEVDLARYYELMKKPVQAKAWQERSIQRSETMNKLMWDKGRNLFFDYNFKRKKRGTVGSLAGFYPMWAGLASDAQAAKMVKALRRFEEKGGVVTTEPTVMEQIVPGQIFQTGVPTQWAHPNGWAPLQYIVIQGLERYGYHENAKRIAMKWLSTNTNWFEKHGEFLEKYNVVDPAKPPMKGVYPSQTGFGWTNAVFERLCQDYIDTSK